MIHMAYYPLDTQAHLLWHKPCLALSTQAHLRCFFGLVLVPIVSLITRQSDADKAHAEKGVRVL